MEKEEYVGVLLIPSDFKVMFKEKKLLCPDTRCPPEWG